MSCIKNDKIWEAAYSDFEELFLNSDSFYYLIKKLIRFYETNDMPLLDTDSSENILSLIFNRLKNFDEDLLLSNKRECIYAQMMFIDSMKNLKKLSSGA